MRSTFIDLFYLCSFNGIFETNCVNAVGTAQKIRNALPIGMDEVLDRGESDHRVSKDGLVMFKWQDNKCASVLSNFHGTEISSVQRTQKDGSKFQFPCPEAVADYNKYMSEVDKADMLCSVQRLSRKSKKWWLRIFFGLIDRTIINAQIAYSKIEGESVSVLDYRRAVAQALIARAIPVRAGRPRSMRSQQEPTKRRKTDHSIGLEGDPVTEQRRGKCTRKNEGGVRCVR